MENSDKKETFSFSKELDGVTKRVSGEQVENGWLITIHKEWYEESGMDGKQYKSGCWKYISKENPLNKLKDGKDANGRYDEAGDALGMLKDITSSAGMLLVD